MAELVLGIGMSHSPMVVTDGSVWPQFAAADRNSRFLRDALGQPITFAQLERTRQGRYAAECEPERLVRQSETVRSALQQLRGELERSRAEVVVVLGDDQMELHDLSHMPAIGVFYGAELVSAIGARFGTYEQDVGSLDFRAGYGQERHHRWPGHEQLGRHLISSLVEQSFDVAAMAEVRDDGNSGVGHAFGIVAVQLIGPRQLPMVPVYLNTYWPPNQVPPRRCWQLGVALRRAIEDYPEPLRVAAVASGGLSHFVTDEVLDTCVREALRAGDEAALSSLPAHKLNGGNSEIRNWIALAALCRGLEVAWDVYEPVYRTPVGTGCGLSFMCWS
jgi:Catalytic LigB subunit of aromatic ring-opening dioxygenase